MSITLSFHETRRIAAISIKFYCVQSVLSLLSSAIFILLFQSHSVLCSFESKVKPACLKIGNTVNAKGVTRLNIIRCNTSKLISGCCLFSCLCILFSSIPSQTHLAVSLISVCCVSVPTIFRPLCFLWLSVRLPFFSVPHIES